MITEFCLNFVLIMSNVKYIQLINMKYIPFVWIKNMEKSIEVEEFEKIEEDNLQDDEPMIGISFDSEIEMYSYC